MLLNILAGCAPMDPQIISTVTAQAANRLDKKTPTPIPEVALPLPRIRRVNVRTDEKTSNAPFCEVTLPVRATLLPNTVGTDRQMAGTSFVFTENTASFSYIDADGNVVNLMLDENCKVNFGVQIRSSE